MRELVHTLARPRKPSITLPAHVHRVVSRGREYFTYHYARGTKQAGPRIKLPHPTDEGFLTAVRKAAGGRGHPAAGTFGALVEAYRASPEWGELSAASRDGYGRYLHEIDEFGVICAWQNWHPAMSSPCATGVPENQQRLTISSACCRSSSHGVSRAAIALTTHASTCAN